MNPTLTALFALCLMSCSTPSPAATAAAAVSFDYMADLRKAEADVVAAEEDPEKQRFSWSMLATQQSMIGDTELAIDSFRKTGLRRSSKSPAEGVNDPEVRDALGAIIEAVRDRQIVMINEAHHVPRDRAFATLVAIELRKLGFKYLAMETLYERTEEMTLRAYPVVEDGYYSRDPIFGDFIRRAMAAGFVPVAYEHANFQESDPQKKHALREEGQARNIVARILKKDPAARVLVHVGYGHMRKSAGGAASVPLMMAEYLRSMTGIEPYGIDQTQPLPSDETLTRALIDAAPSDAFVVTARDAARPYLATPEVDMFVFHKPTRLVNGRPHWLKMNGYRKQRKIPVAMLPKAGRRLIQAFVAGESADAVPMDQVLVTAGKPVPVLMLPKGKYRFAFQE
jgi:hypothetical protein